jgi:hypothetical protein
MGLRPDRDSLDPQINLFQFPAFPASISPSVGVKQNPQIRRILKTKPSFYRDRQDKTLKTGLLT